MINSRIDLLRAEVERLLKEASKPVNGQRRGDLIGEATRLHLEAVALLDTQTGRKAGDLTLDEVAGRERRDGARKG
jgi:hypothetical protein